MHQRSRRGVSGTLGESSGAPHSADTNAAGTLVPHMQAFVKWGVADLRHQAAPVPQPLLSPPPQNNARRSAPPPPPPPPPPSPPYFLARFSAAAKGSFLPLSASSNALRAASCSRCAVRQAQLVTPGRRSRRACGGARRLWEWRCGAQRQPGATAKAPGACSMTGGRFWAPASPPCPCRDGRSRPGPSPLPPHAQSGEARCAGPARGGRALPPACAGELHAARAWGGPPRAGRSWAALFDY